MCRTSKTEELPRLVVNHLLVHLKIWFSPNFSSARVDKDLHTHTGAHSVTQALLCLIDSNSAPFCPITTPDIRYDNIVSQKADKGLHGLLFQSLLSGFCRSYSEEETIP